jgi:hypothetical protein
VRGPAGQRFLRRCGIRIYDHICRRGTPRGARVRSSCQCADLAAPLRLHVSRTILGTGEVSCKNRRWCPLDGSRCGERHADREGHGAGRWDRWRVRWQGNSGLEKEFFLNRINFGHIIEHQGLQGPAHGVTDEPSKGTVPGVQRLLPRDDDERSEVVE